MSTFESTKPKQTTYKLSYANDFDGSSQEIVIKSSFQDGIGFEELMNGFRQFVLALGYSEYTARHIICVGEEYIELLGLSEDDFQIVET